MARLIRATGLRLLVCAAGALKRLPDGERLIVLERSLDGVAYGYLGRAGR